VGLVVGVEVEGAGGSYLVAGPGVEDVAAVAEELGGGVFAAGVPGDVEADVDHGA